MHRCLPVLALLVTLLAGCAALVDADLRQANSTGQPVYIGHLAAAKPDRRGRIAVAATIFNTSPKTYRYVDLTVAAQRRRTGVAGHDPTAAKVTLRLAGPLRPRRTAGLTTWRNVWHGERVSCVDIVGIVLTDMDGGVIVVDGPALAGVQSRRLRRGCDSPGNLPDPARKSLASG